MSFDKLAVLQFVEKENLRQVLKGNYSPGTGKLAWKQINYYSLFFIGICLCIKIVVLWAH